MSDNQMPENALRPKAAGVGERGDIVSEGDGVIAQRVGREPVMEAAEQTPAERTVIEPRSGWVSVDFAELWRHRELLYFLVWRDVKVRYKQTVLGAAWAIIRPFISMVIFSIIFGKFIFGNLANNPVGNVPYPVFVYAGLLAWTLFTDSVSQAALSTVNESQLLQKIYFPRLFLPISRTGTALVDFVLGLVVYFGIMFWYGSFPGAALALLPLMVLLTALISLGVALILASLTVAYRDFRAMVPFLLQIWMYASPVVYPTKLIPERYHWVLVWNPMAGIISGYRSALLNEPLDWGLLAPAAVISTALFIFGLYYFRRAERRFADIA